MVIRSKQTPDKSFFAYNPFRGGDVHLYPIDRPMENPRVFILETDIMEPSRAYACRGRVELIELPCGQIICKVNGKRTERFSVKFPGRKHKQRWSSR